jgi:mannose-1-phosphate guanylyltransferase
MPIDYCLILAAGFGTRMGVIGHQLPKVLWPVFEKTLLELQVAYARSLGVKKIYINLHFMGQEIEDFCRSKSSFEDVIFLWEKPEILDIGGAIHNLAALPDVSYRGKLLVLNADQFFYIPKDELIKFQTENKRAPSILFTYWVDSSLGYNAIEVDEKRIFKTIIKNKDLPLNKKVETYTGVSLIDLNQLKPVSGASAFFNSVCLYKEQTIPTILLDKIDYWDFGTLKRYWESCFRILETYAINSNHPFLRFLVNERALKTWKINLQKASYHASSSHVINLGAEPIGDALHPSIFLDGSATGPQKAEVPAVYWRDLHEEVKSS